VCVRNGRYVTDEEGAPCVCTPVQCSKLPARIRMTLSGVYRVAQDVTIDNPTTGTVQSNRQDVEVAIPPTIITLDKEGDANEPPRYSTQVSCDLPVAGNGSQQIIPQDDGFEAVYKRILNISVTPRGYPIFDDQGELVGFDCALGIISVQFVIDQYDVASPDPTTPIDSVVVASASYHSLNTPIVGTHFSFGNDQAPGIDGRVRRTTCIDGFGNGTNAVAYDPPSITTTDPFTGVITTDISSFTSWRVC